MKGSGYMYDRGNHTKPRLKLPGATTSMQWATPHHNAATGPGTRGRGGENIQTQAALWATPTSRDWRSDSSQKSDAEIYGTKGRPLGRQAPRSGIGGPPSSPVGPTSPRQWKTPHGAGNVDYSGKMGGGGEFHKQAVNWQTPRTGTHGVPGADKSHGGQPKGMKLNSRFVEWLMGLPICYTCTCH